MPLKALPQQGVITIVGLGVEPPASETAKKPAVVVMSASSKSSKPAAPAPQPTAEPSPPPEQMALKALALKKRQKMGKEKRKQGWVWLILPFIQGGYSVGETEGGHINFSPVDENVRGSSPLGVKLLWYQPTVTIQRPEGPAPPRLAPRNK
ncbi:hypothetical protein [Entomobacter blattae]|uniref:hypothetical protein n=1 Tax=Entomobacter blattae TaxID=2762277 RepID=UPI00193B2DED|nr:hypothetical protein [Entomobacter blattae]